jgi:hypothetical protein
MPKAQRLTLVACDDTDDCAAWNDAAHSRRFAFIGGGPLLRLVILAALNEPTLDAERLIIDRVATAEVFLEILASVPAEFSGDLLRIDERGGGFLSATGRGGDRVLYALQPDDVRFYLAMHDLVHHEELEMIA